MPKEEWIQHDSLSGKNFNIEKKVRGEKIDIFVSKPGTSKKHHDHGWIDGKGKSGYEDRGISKI